MRRITLAVMGTISAVVALMSYHTSTNSGISTAGGTASSDASASSGDSTPTPSTTSGSSTNSSDPSSSSGTSSSSHTYTGTEANTRWGIVEVQITVKNGRITASTALEYPNGNPRDQQINSDALPRLTAEVLKNQSAAIDAISGATVTSDGYIQSLQSAVDQANL